MKTCSSCRAASLLNDLPCPWKGHDGYPTHPRGCENVERDPDVWLPETVRTAKLRAGGPLPPKIVPSPSPMPSAPSGIGVEIPFEAQPCPHRAGRWCCGETLVTCAIGRGSTPGYVEKRDCDACEVPSQLIRVGIVSTVFGFGGTERWAAQIVRATASENVQWIGVAVAAGESCVNREAVEGMRLMVPILAGPNAVKELTESCDVVILWAKHANEKAEPLEELPCGTIMVAHGDGPYTRDSVCRAAVCDVLAAVSDSAVPPFPEAEQHRVRVIYNAVEPTAIPVEDRRAYRDAARRAWGIGDDRKVVGFLARTSFEKGPDLFLDAVEALPESWLGVMVGPYQDHIRPELERRKLGGRILLAGETSHTHAALLGFDVLLMPSREEGFCYSATEAIDLEIPVVMTPVGFAASHGGLVTGIPTEATGDVMAEAVLQAVAQSRDSLAATRDAARLAFDFKAFGAEWTKAIVDAATAKRQKAKAGRSSSWQPPASRC